ncbi:[NiFe] hydrogenase metallocenter assemblyprotein HypE [Salmonella enterica subsp. enterica]|nr:[NiFe] hydrogenase metallocenter assemblyprotein HypE [Salmonella enterica subsp. enterica]
MNNIQLAHGSGGQAMQQLINSLFMEAFANPWLAEQEDQARLELAQLTAEGDRLAFSTDSYVIDPLFFPRRQYRQTGDLRYGERRSGERRDPPLSLLRLYP